MKTKKNKAHSQETLTKKLTSTSQANGSNWSASGFAIIAVFSIQRLHWNDRQIVTEPRVGLDDGERYLPVPGSPDAVLTVTRSGGSDGTVTVKYTSGDGSARHGDYTTITGSVTWADGEDGPKDIEVPLTADTTAPQSIEMTSPSASTRGPGIPWTTSSLTEAQIVAGNGGWL